MVNKRTQSANEVLLDVDLEIKATQLIDLDRVDSGCSKPQGISDDNGAQTPI